MAKTSHAVRMLACASAMGDLSAARAILPNSPNAAQDWLPIMDASYKGFPQVVELLVKHGADVNALSSSEQNRPLHRAVEQGHHEVIEVLIRSGADVEARGTWPQITPLVRAAFSGRPRIVDQLVRHAAKVDRFAAAATGKIAKATPGVDINSMTTLHYCAGSALDRPELVKIAARLVEDGADANAKASKLGHAVTPSKLATRNQPVAELLLDHEADPNDVFRDVLLTGCNYKFAEALLARGAELNPHRWAGETLLHVAIHWGRLSSAEWLLEKGGDPNTARAKDGWTPLHQAASRGVASIVGSDQTRSRSPKERSSRSHCVGRGTGQKTGGRREIAGVDAIMRVDYDRIAHDYDEPQRDHVVDEHLLAFLNQKQDIVLSKRALGHQLWTREATRS